MSFSIAELQRRIENLVRVGTIEAADYSGHTPKCRVRMGELLSDWIPMSQPRAGGNRVFQAFEVGEQVLLAAPGGDFAQAVVLASVNQSGVPAAASHPDIHRIDYGNGDFIEHDRASGTLTLQLQGDLTIRVVGNVAIQADGDIAIKAAGNLDLEAASIRMTGPVTQTGGDMTSDGISAQHHVHGGVSPGGGNTVGPQ